ncbi:hypothetical protein MRX96_041069 [Rhipicephalus microplus]
MSTVMPVFTVILSSAASPSFRRLVFFPGSVVYAGFSVSLMKPRALCYQSFGAACDEPPRRQTYPHRAHVANERCAAAAEAPGEATHGEAPAAAS